MRNLLKFTCLNTLILLIFAGKAYTAAPPDLETIKSFATVINVNSNGTVEATEVITYDFKYNQKRGIFRELKEVYTNDKGEKYKTNIEVLSVTDLNQNSYKYETYSENDNFVIKIGDKDKYVTQTMTYVIRYKMSGAIENYSDHDEIYWNVTGNGWEVPIEVSAAVVYLPSNIPTDSSTFQTNCFAGAYGTKNSNNCKIDIQKNQNILGQTVTIINYINSGLLNPGEGLTIHAGFDKGYIQALPKSPVKPSIWESPIVKVILAAAWFLWYIVTPAIVAIYYWRNGRDPKRNTAIPALFEVTDEKGNRLSPAMSGAIADETVDNKEITATIVDLAIRGYLTIKEDGGNGMLDKVMNTFAGGKTYTLTKSHDFKTKDTHSAQGLNQYEQIVLDGLFGSNQTVNTAELKNNFYIDAAKAKGLLYKQIQEEGYFPHNPETVRGMWIAFGVFALFTINVPLGAMCIVFSFFMPRKTLKGVKAQTDILGVKKFLTSQEKTLEHQELTWQLFEKLLPYAIVLGVTGIWTKRFEDLGQIPAQTSWYQGPSALNAVGLNNTFNSFNSSVNAFSASPTSSGSGFSSGGGGGGFSGGGSSGGGGGGSW